MFNKISLTSRICSDISVKLHQTMFEMCLEVCRSVHKEFAELRVDHVAVAFDFSLDLLNVRASCDVSRLDLHVAEILPEDTGLSFILENR